MPPSEVEICVIGGGPAGATIAGRLASLGHQVCLIEKSPFPRRHVGESLSPGILPLFDFLGLRQKMEEASFLRPEGAMVSWNGVQRRLDFTAGVPGFQVDRGRFDHLLLEMAKQAGVRVVQPAHAGRPKALSESEWRIPVYCGGTRWTLNASFLVDASGRRRVLRGQNTHTAKATLAIYGYWRGVRLQGAETRVEAGQNEWFWGAPLPDHTFNATVFVDPSRCQFAGGRRRMESLYRSLLAGSKLLRNCLAGELVSPVSACDATPHLVERPVTTSSIKVGEASLAIDPLSSQGVQAAIASAIQGSIVVHTILTRPENAAAALRFYGDRQRESAEYHQQIAAQYYFKQASVLDKPFWRERAGNVSEQMQRDYTAERKQGRTVFAEDRQFKVSEVVRFVETPCISGDLIRLTTAVTHPAFERPMAFIKNVEIAPLLRLIKKPQTGSEILRLWSAFVSPSSVREILEYLCLSEVLVADDF